MEENSRAKETLTEKYHFNDTDFKTIKNKGIPLPKIVDTLSFFEQGISKTIIERPAIIGDGITAITPEIATEFALYFDTQKANYTLEKFVPASGAASRMFKFLSDFLLDFNPEKETINGYINRSNNSQLSVFLIGIDKFPFFNTINQHLAAHYPDFNHWNRDQKNFHFIKTLLSDPAFDFSNKPKGILPFHNYDGVIVSPTIEHLKETVLYSKSKEIAKIHFTISKEFEQDFETLIQEVRNEVREEVTLESSFSFQQESTDTLAVDAQNKPLRDKNNQLIFRPGGHGALIHNLNERTSDIVFIKNIDNVSHNNLKQISLYKKALAGFMLRQQSKVFELLETLDQEFLNKETVIEITKVVQQELNFCLDSNFEDFKKESQIKYLKNVLNRPIRVCGMVRNENEPGGGPFWIKDEFGNISLQIVESSQIDLKNEKQAKIFGESTHFNPVDIVCGLKNYKNEKFDLTKFINPNSGFIVEKSKQGIQYKAYELPGLWNGAMAYWNTFFVEVPLETFNPVKTVNDLLKPAHQPS